MGKILLIDDAKFARGMLRNILERAGYEICGEASNGKDGLKKFQKLKPDLVFCDIMMDEMDGMECLRAILAEDPNANVIICTSASDHLHVDEAMKTGAREFMAKPMAAKDVIRVAETYIGKPELSSPTSYKALMEQRAEAGGIKGKPLLDFFEAFERFSGLNMDDPKVDKEFLKKDGESLIIGVRAMLAAKMSLAQMDQLTDIFLKLTS